MKEHLNLNTVSVTSGWVDTPQNQERLTARLNAPQVREELFPGGAKGESVAAVTDDLFESSVQSSHNFNAAAIEAMDFAAAMEQVNFIQSQSLLPEGRQKMSLAHHSITPQRVMQLLGTM